MTKFSKILILLFLFISTSSTFAGALSYEELVKTINSKVYSETKDKLSKISSDFKINITGIPKENFKTENSAPLRVEIISQNVKFMPNSYKRVIIRDSGNNIVKAFPINVQTSVYKEVLVANGLIPYNQELKIENTTTEKREISKYLGKTYPDYKTGLVASRNIQKGSIILTDYVKAKSVISKNSIVEIIFLSDKGLRITLQGKALKDGGIGDTIPVRSDKYNKIYNAKVNSFNEVMVRI